MEEDYAQQLDLAGQKEEEGSMPGTPDYLAPEILLGLSHGTPPDTARAVVCACVCLTHVRVRVRVQARAWIGGRSGVCCTNSWWASRPSADRAWRKFSNGFCREVPTHQQLQPTNYNTTPASPSCWL